MSEHFEPDAVGVTSREGTVVVVLYHSSDCYFRPDTEEIVFVAQDDAGSFETHCRQMAHRMAAFHEAKAAYSLAIESYGLSMHKPPSALESDRLHVAIDQAERLLKEKQAEIKLEVGELTPDGSGYAGVVELIPLNGHQESKGRKRRSMFYFYAASSKYAELEQRGKLCAVSLNSHEADKNESIYQRDKAGKVKIDEQRLAERLIWLGIPVLRSKLPPVHIWNNASANLAHVNAESVLFEWARSWNASLNTQVSGGDNLDVSAAAQFMRFASNVAMSRSFQLEQSAAPFKGEARGQLALASGVAEMTMYAPDRLGWHFGYLDGDGQGVDMGTLRVQLQPTLSGFIGASGLIEGQLQIVSKDDQQGLAGQAGGQLPSFWARRQRGMQFQQQQSEDSQGLRLAGEGFAGGRVEAGLKGSLQWLKPSPPIDWTETTVIPSYAGRFTDICTVSSSIAGLTGIGAGGNLHCTFEKGKFRIYVAASFCWGVGAKGTLACEVDEEQFYEFSVWLMYQLYLINYGFLHIMPEAAFKIYWQSRLARLIFFSERAVDAFDLLQATVDDFGSHFKNLIATLADDRAKGQAASLGRNRLAVTIVRDPKTLLLLPPEGKGTLLYLLTRHGSWDFGDMGNRGVGPIPDAFHTRKEAVISVLKSIQTRAEWLKVMCRITVDGESMAEPDNEAEVALKHEVFLEQFLQNGFNRHLEVFETKKELAKIREKLRDLPNSGYALSMNDSEYYNLNYLDNPCFPHRCLFEPLSQSIFDPKVKA